MNKENIALPKGFEGAYIGDKWETITNPFTNQSCKLPPNAVAVYDSIKGAEMFGMYPIVRKGLDWFRKHFAKEYMILLD
jgi:hypothetical protein